MGDLSEHFNREEFACHCGCGFDDIDPRLVAGLEKLRAATGMPIHILSGCRCPAHNRVVGGARFSFHTVIAGRNDQGMAADIYIPGLSLRQIIMLAQGLPEFRDGGIGRYEASGFVHLDVRGWTARW